MNDRNTLSVPKTEVTAEPIDTSLNAIEYQEISDEIERISDQLDDMLARVNDFLKNN